MNTNVYENTDSETITPLNKRRICLFPACRPLRRQYSGCNVSTAFYIREMGGSPLIIGIIIATEALANLCGAPDWPPFRSRWPQANTDCHSGYCGDKSTITRQRAMYPVYPARPHAFWH